MKLCMGGKSKLILSKKFGIKNVASFDSDFDKVKDIERISL